MDRLVLGIEHDDECGLVPYALDREQAEQERLEVLQLPDETRRIVTMMLIGTDDAKESERNVITDLLQYSFQLGRIFERTDKLDGSYPRSQLYIGPDNST